MSEKKLLNDILDKTKDRVTFFEHAIPNLPDTKPRDTVQRSRVIAVEMQWISKHLDLTKFSRPKQELVSKWKKFM
jgi:hypothetical protein